MHCRSPWTVINQSRTGDRLAAVRRAAFLVVVAQLLRAGDSLARPGLAMRDWQWSPGTLANVPLTLSLLLLSVMLFVAALLTDVTQIRFVLQHPLLLCLAMAAVWLGPALLVVVAGWVVPWAVGGQSTAGLLVGLALVASMPVANSSVGWTQSAAAIWA